MSKSLQQYKLLIKDYKKDISIGIFPHEKSNKQPVKISLKVFSNYPKFDQTDDQKITIDNLINYDNIIKIIDDVTFDQHYDLLEELANKLIISIGEIKEITKIKITIKKLKAIKDAKYSGLKITWVY